MSCSRLFFILSILCCQFIYSPVFGVGLESSFLQKAQEVLAPDLAFRIEAQHIQDHVIVHWDIAPGYYLYKDKFQFDVAEETAIQLGQYTMPEGQIKDDPLFGEVMVYYGAHELFIPVSANRTFEFTVHYQGCKEDSVCYPPLEKRFTLTRSEGLSLDSGEIQASSGDSISAQLKKNNLWLNMFSFFVFGLLMSLTPCIFPMIPIVSGMLIGAHDQQRLRSMILSVSYVLAMATSYALLGMLASIFHLNLQIAAQAPWVILLFSGVFVALALSMFGFYPLQLPSKWMPKFMASGSRTTILNAATMGVLSSLIVGPCIAPPLAGALLYISQTGDVVLGGATLFAMGIGFGMPLLLIGLGAETLLPRAGQWMTTIKHCFGVIMLGVACWFLARILPASVSLILWALLLVNVAVFIGVFKRSDQDSSPFALIRKGVGVVVLVYGILLVIAAATNHQGTVLEPFPAGLWQTDAKESLAFSKINDLQMLESALQSAHSQGKKAMLEFYADWCAVCQQLERETFSAPRVQDNLKEFVLLKVDMTKNTPEHQALLAHFELFAPPAILFFADTQEIRTHRLLGFIAPDDFIHHINKLL